MAKENETIADIIAEMRSDANADEYTPDGILGQKLNYIADRLEAAYKREKAAIEADALAVGEIVEAAHKLERGNCAKLREALGKILWCLKWMFDNTDDKSVQSHLGEPIALAKAALAEPMRNCDVGSAEEQEDRFRLYCNSRGTFCGDCPLYKNRRGECRFAWAQMPYEEGGAK